MTERIVLFLLELFPKFDFIDIISRIQGRQCHFKVLRYGCGLLLQEKEEKRLHITASIPPGLQMTIRAVVNHQITIHRVVPVVAHRPVRIRGQHPVIHHQILAPGAVALPVPEWSICKSFGFQIPLFPFLLILYLMDFSY